MVRVCTNKKCPRPHHVFGCVFYTGKILSCDDCGQKKPGIYAECTVRRIEPSPEDAYSGLCSSCTDSVKQISKPVRRHKTRTVHHAAAPF